LHYHPAIVEFKSKTNFEEKLINYPLAMEEIGIKVEEKAEDMSTATPAGQEDWKNADLDDLYTKYKKLQQQLEFLQVQEEYIKDEQRNLKKEYLHAQEEVKRIQSVPLVIGQFLEAVDQNTGIVGMFRIMNLRLLIENVSLNLYRS
jgi:ATP-dependent 26S proteasome regulatory subunit